MKIIKEKSRAYKGKDYYKYRINLPEVVLKRAGLKAGDKLDIETKEDLIVLKKSKD